MACKQHVITLQSIQVAGSQLSVRYSYDDYHFSQSFWYDFNLQSLDTIYGSQFMEKVYFHCAAFSVFQLCSLKPDVLDWGPYAHLHTAEFEMAGSAPQSGGEEDGGREEDHDCH